MLRHWNLHGGPLSAPLFPTTFQGPGPGARKGETSHPSGPPRPGNPHWSPLTLAKCVRNSGHVVAIRGDSGRYNAQPASVLQPEPLQLRRLREPTLQALWKTSQTLLPCQVMGMACLAVGGADGGVCVGVCARVCCVCMCTPVCRCAPPPHPRPGTCSCFTGPRGNVFIFPVLWDKNLAVCKI